MNMMSEVGASIKAFVDNYMYWINIPHINKIDVVEIIIIAFLLYEFLVWVRTTRAWMLFKGIIVVVIFLIVAAFFQMNTILWLAGKLVSVAAIALVIIFQPELRNALDRLGRQNFLRKFLSLDNKNARRFSEKTINDVVKACYEMGQAKTGALIVIEGDVPLDEYIHTGIEIDSLVSEQLLLNIFEHNTPLHDGAVIMRSDRLVAATCYLPLSEDRNISKDLGTRHRAAKGISEVSDSLTIVVSEETGAISLAENGEITRGLTSDQLREKLESASKLVNTENNLIRRRLNNAKEDSEDNNK